MSELAANLAVGCSILLAGVSALLLLVGLVSYARVRHPRLLWVALAFSLMCAQGVVLALASYRDRLAIAEGELFLPGLAVLGLATALTLYVSVLKR
jgi:hypothetical protein